MPQFVVSSASNADKTYTVTIDEGAPDHCTCVAWVMKRNRTGTGECKHVREVRKTGGTGLSSTPPPPKPTPLSASGMPLLRPMLANSIDPAKLPKLVSDDTVAYQQKLDGHRIILRIEDGTLTAIERKGGVSQHNARFQAARFKNAVAKVPNMILDGELLADGTLWVFDAPWIAGTVEPTTPFGERLDVLEVLWQVWQPECFKLLPTARDPEAKALLALACSKNRAEGVIVRKLSGEYQEGKRSSNVLKSKFVKTADLVVTQVSIGGKDNLAVAVYRDGDLVEVGHVSTIGKPDCAVGDVIEVRYLYLGAGDRLVQPTILKKRPDRTPDECFFDQLVITNKDVIV